MLWTLDGAFATADYSYRLTSDYVKFDETGFNEPARRGKGEGLALADARSDPPFRARNYWNRRCGRGDACQSQR